MKIMNHLNWRFPGVLAITVAVLGLAQAQAQFTIVSNLHVPTYEPSEDETPEVIGSDSWWGQGFTSPASSDYSISTVILRLSRELTDFEGSIDVSLWNATGVDGRPGAQIASIASAVPVESLSSVAWADEPFVLASPIPLEPSTSYFIVLQGSAPEANSGAYWRDTEPEQPMWIGDGEGGGYTFSSDQGQSWQVPEPTVPFQMALISPVPEPAFYAFLSGAGLLAFATVRKWRRCRQFTA